jgi:flagellar motor switch protein FliN/FliY
MAHRAETALALRIELGRTRLAVLSANKLAAGSLVVLDQPSGDPVDIFAEGRLIARGQVVVLDNNFCVQVTELIDAEQAA